MTGEKNFWSTVPGILTGIAGIIAGLAALVTAYSNLKDDPNPKIPNPIDASQELTIPADSVRGVPFINSDSKAVKVDFATTGTWVAIPENTLNIPDSAKGDLSANGAPDFRVNDNMPCPRFPMGALVVVKGDSCIVSGRNGSLFINPEETIYFKMNDVNTLYGDNSGSIRVRLSISR